MKKTLFLIISFSFALFAFAQTEEKPDTILKAAPLDYNIALKEEYITYKSGDQTCIGYMVYDDKFSGHLPGVLVVHEWWGLNDYPEMRARRLAELGYVAFACDIYGNGFKTDDPKVAQEKSNEFKNNRKLLRERAQAGLDALKKFPVCDSSRVAAIGYCFGGGTVLELARSGADVEGVVSFHGFLNTPNPQDAENIKGKVLVLHGADDTFVPPAEVAAFTEEMNNAKVDWKLVRYSGAVHAFSNPNAGDDPKTGVAYNPLADRRSLDASNSFLHDILYGDNEKK